MKFENTEVFNFEGAIRGMRNPLESWQKSDSFSCSVNEEINCDRCPYYIDNHDISEAECIKDNEGYFDYRNNLYIIGKNDLELMQKLIKAGSEHRKFLRQIFVSVDITAPLYWWKEFDTYKVGTVANSTSTMHKLASTPITKDCFELGEMLFSTTIENLENLRVSYNCTKDKNEWKKLIVNLPESWLQTRTVTMNYENVLSMIHQRQNHKLSEWSVSFIEWAKLLPYADELLFLEDK